MAMGLLSRHTGGRADVGSGHFYADAALRIRMCAPWRVLRTARVPTEEWRLHSLSWGGLAATRVQCACEGEPADSRRRSEAGLLNAARTASRPSEMQHV